MARRAAIGAFAVYALLLQGFLAASAPAEAVVEPVALYADAYGREESALNSARKASLLSALFLADRTKMFHVKHLVRLQGQSTQGLMRLAAFCGVRSRGKLVF